MGSPAHRDPIRERSFAGFRTTELRPHPCGDDRNIAGARPIPASISGTAEWAQSALDLPLRRLVSTDISSVLERMSKAGWPVEQAGGGGVFTGYLGSDYRLQLNAVLELGGQSRRRGL